MPVGIVRIAIHQLLNIRLAESLHCLALFILCLVLNLLRTFAMAQCVNFDTGRAERLTGSSAD